MSYKRELVRWREQHQEEAERGHRDLPLFASFSTMARRSEPAAARQAAAGTPGRPPALHHRVHAAFIPHGAMAAKQAKRLPRDHRAGVADVRQEVGR